ncbi:MAG: hydrogenase maturation nickel metallochaperone HypA [Anaerolineales bacterium]
MHELAITEQIAEIAIKHGEKNAAQSITDLYLVIGELSSVIDDSVQFYWDLITENTLCEGAKLHFKRISALFLCRDCGKEYSLVEGELTPCPNCQSNQMEILQGKEFHLDSINII